MLLLRARDSFRSRASKERGSMYSILLMYLFPSFSINTHSITPSSGGTTIDVNSNSSPILFLPNVLAMFRHLEIEGFLRRVL